MNDIFKILWEEIQLRVIYVAIGLVISITGLVSPDRAERGMQAMAKAMTKR
jgi:hypothetical protein